LYDEAALLLRQAALEHPERTDIEVKLAETYFAAGKTAEFEATAAAVKPRLSAADWQKLAIMGQQLDPGSGLFKDAAQAPLVADVDLSFVMPDKAPPASSSEPRTAESLTAAPEPASVNFEFGTMPLQESTATASRTRPARDDKGLDFRLDELELPSLDAASGPPPAAGDPLNLATDPEGDDMLDFDLGSFDLDPPPAAPASATPPAEGNASVDFDLGDFDLAEPAAPAAPASQPGFGAMTPEPLLDEFDFDAESAESADISGDEAGTKLDLARAYVEMGDNEMAHSLLGEVLMQGSEQQRRDAQALLGRLV
jgi:FimV-like protein